ncbi:MAG: hypothetical protein ACYTFM_08670 [Planctomycetota bacterium]|jgi:hypothetical protein
MLGLVKKNSAKAGRKLIASFVLLALLSSSAYAADESAHMLLMNLSA